METKHTKGKWEVKVNDTEAQEVFVKTDKAAIARFFENNSEVKSKEEAIANAKLFVSARDLLDCLKRLDAAASLALHTGDNGLHNFVQLMLINTKEAIKKATE